MPSRRWGLSPQYRGSARGAAAPSPPGAAARPLDLGSVPNSDYSVVVNGTEVPYPDQMDPSRIDIGAQLEPGVNQITVRIATLLGNARGQSLTQGLVGPVRVVPYGQAVVYASTSQDGAVGGTVPATLSLSLGAPASFGAFTPGTARDYFASTTATVISTAGDATLSVADPSGTATGRLVNGPFSLPQPLRARAANTGTAYNNVGSSLTLQTYHAPVSNDAVSLEFKQSIGSGDALRTGTYGKTLTFTLATTTP